MADLSITAATVVAGTGALPQDGTSGATVTAGAVVYEDTTTNTWKLAQCDGTVTESTVKGIAMNGASANQPLRVIIAGPYTVGATVAIGTVYALSATAGSICPIADITSGQYVTVLGVATSATV